MKYLICACCGTAIRGWQHYDRDTGYGICKECEKYYGYHTEGNKPEEKSKRLYLGVIEKQDNTYRTFIVKYIDPTKRVYIHSAGDSIDMDSFDDAWLQIYNVACGIRHTGNLCCIGGIDIDDDAFIAIDIDKIKDMTGQEFIKHLTLIGFDTENLYA